MALNELLIAHQDGVLRFRLRRGGYSVEANRLCVSVDTENVEDKDPVWAMFCLADFPLVRPPQMGDAYEFSGGLNVIARRGELMAAAYFGFHADRVAGRWTVLGRTGEKIIFGLEATHDDVNYYDARAKRTPTTGEFELGPVPRDQLWIPL